MSCVNAHVPACGFIPVIHIPQAGAVPSGPSLGIFPDVSMPALLFRKLVQRIREEFEDAPNLRMTVSEAARFWGLDFANLRARAHRASSHWVSWREVLMSASGRWPSTNPSGQD